MNEYKGRIIEKVSNGWVYESMLWPNLELLHGYIDAQIRGENPKVIIIPAPGTKKL